MAALTPPDWIALAVFLLCWIAYAVVTDRVPAIRARSVIAAMDEHRRRWMVAMLERENRIADAATIGNLMQSTSFLATTCARGRKCLRYRGFSPASPFSAVTRHTHPRALCPTA